MRTRLIGRVTRLGRMIVSKASQSVINRIKRPVMANKSFIQAPTAFSRISGVGREQKLLQLGETVGKRNGFFLPVKKRLQALGHFRLQAGGAGDGFSEFSGMRRGQHNSARGSVILFGVALPAQHAY